MTKVEEQNNRIRKFKRLYNIHCLVVIVLGFFLIYTSIRDFLGNSLSFCIPSLIVGLLVVALLFALSLYPKELYKTK